MSNHPLKDRTMVLENTYQRKLAQLDGIRNVSEEMSHELKTQGWRVIYGKSREGCFRRRHSVSTGPGWQEAQAWELTVRWCAGKQGQETVV